MLSLKDFNPRPYEPGEPGNICGFFGFPEVIKNEVAVTHPECVVRFSQPVAAQSAKSL